MIPSVSTEHSFISFFDFLHLASDFCFFDLKYFCKLRKIKTFHLPDELYGPVSQQEPHGPHDDNDGWLLLLHTLQYSSQDDFPAQSADSNWLTRQHGMGGRTTGLCVGGGFDGTAFCSRYHISNILVTY